jgi:hypothetical protein
MIFDETFSENLSANKFHVLSDSRKLFGDKVLKQEQYDNLFDFLKGWDDAIKVITDAQNKN